MVLMHAFLAAGAVADVLYDKDGLVVTRASESRRDWNTGQSQSFSTSAIRFRGKALCGTDVGALLYPDGAEPAGRSSFFCPGPVRVLARGVLAYFNSSSGAGSQLAHLAVVDGALRVQRIALSDTPARDRVHGTRFMDARMPGWTRVESAWGETVLIRHDPFQAVRLGEGRLLDLAPDAAFLVALPRQEVASREPDRIVEAPDGSTGIAYGRVVTKPTPLAFRAVRWSDGRELARLEIADPCVVLPDLEFEPSGTGRQSGIDRIAYEDVPAWRQRLLMYLQPSAGKASLRLQPGQALPRKPGCGRDEGERVSAGRGALPAANPGPPPFAPPPAAR